MSGLFASEGGYQVFELRGGEWAVLYLSAASAIIAILVGFSLAKNVLAQDEGSPKMQEIAKAIQEGAAAYLRRQFKTIGVHPHPARHHRVRHVDRDREAEDGRRRAELRSSPACGAPSPSSSAVSRPGSTGYIGMTLATRGNVRTAAAALTNSMPKALTVAFRTGGVAGMFTVGLGLLGATVIIMVFQNTSSVILIGFGFGGSLLALFLRVGGGIFTKAADVGADLVGKVEAGIPEDDPRNPATIADNVGDNVGDCAGMAADLFESYEVTLVASIILGVAAFNSIGANPALGLIFPVAARAIGVIASIFGVFAVKAKEGETDALEADQPRLPRRRVADADRHAARVARSTSATTATTPVGSASAPWPSASCWRSSSAASPSTTPARTTSRSRTSPRAPRPVRPPSCCPARRAASRARSTRSSPSPSPSASR